jgi:hypothetical protein
MFTLVSFEYGPTRYPFRIIQFGGSRVGPEVIPPEETPVRIDVDKSVPVSTVLSRKAPLKFVEFSSAPVRFAPLSLVAVRCKPDKSVDDSSADVRLAVGPTRYP